MNTKLNSKAGPFRQTIQTFNELERYRLLMEETEREWNAGELLARLWAEELACGRVQVRRGDVASGRADRYVLGWHNFLEDVNLYRNVARNNPTMVFELSFDYDDDYPLPEPESEDESDLEDESETKERELASDSSLTSEEL